MCTFCTLSAFCPHLFQAGSLGNQHINEIKILYKSVPWLLFLLAVLAQHAGGTQVLCNDRVSVCLSVPSCTAGGLRRVCCCGPRGRHYRLLHGASAAGAAAFRFVFPAARRSAANASIVMLSPYSQLRLRQRRLCGLQSNCDDLVTTVQRAATPTKPVNHPVTSYFCHIFIFLASS